MPEEKFPGKRRPDLEQEDQPPVQSVPEVKADPFPGTLVAPEPLNPPIAAGPTFPGRLIEDVDLSGNMADAEPGFLDSMIEYGQAFQDAFTGPSIYGPSSGQGKMLGQMFDVGGQIIGAPLEQLGALTGGDNTMYDLGRAIREATRTPDDVLAQENLPLKFSRGLQQTAAFFYGGGAARKLLSAKSPWATGGIAAWLGSAVGGQAGAEDARRHGATEEQIEIARWANSAFGLSEGLPVAMGFNKLDDITGGFISRRLKSEAGQVIGTGIMQGLEEGLQEAFQTVGENKVAASWAGYDPTRTLTDNLMEATGIGGSVGLTIGILMGMMGVRDRRARSHEITTAVDEKLKELERELTVEGPLINIDDEMRALINERAVLEQEVEALNRQGEAISPEMASVPNQGKTEFDRQRLAAAAAVARAERDLNEKLRPTLNTNRSQTPTRDDMMRSLETHDDQTKWIDNVKALRADKSVHKTEILEKALENDGFALAFNAEENRLKFAVDALERELIGLRKKEEAGTLTALEKTYIEEVELRKKAVQERINRRIVLAREVGKQMRKIVEAVAPLMNNSKIILTDMLPYKPGEKPYGEYYTARINGEIVDVIGLDLDSYLSYVAEGSKQAKVRKGALLNTLVHELGHGIAYHQFYNLVGRTKSNSKTSEKDQKLLKALRDGYNRWLQDTLEAPARKYLANVEGLGHAADTIGVYGAANNLSNIGVIGDQTIGTNVLGFAGTLLRDQDTGQEILGRKYFGGERVGYQLSFSEYLAEQLAKVILDGKTGLIDQDTAPFFADMVDTTQKLVDAFPRFESSNLALRNFAREHAINIKLREALVEQNKRVEQNPITALLKDGLITKETAEEIGEDSVVFNKFMDVALTLIQIAERNPNVMPLQNYLEHIQEWKDDVNHNLAMAERTITQWKNLGRKETELLARLLLDESIGRTPDGGWLAEPREFTAEEIESYSLSTEALGLRQTIKDDFAESLNQMEQVLLDAKRRIFASDSQELGRQQRKVRQEFARMRKTPYFPLMRYGKYTLEIRASGEQRLEGLDYKDGQFVDYQHFETKKERDTAYNLALKHYNQKRVTIARDYLRKPNFSLQGMPITLLEHLESQLQSSKLDKESQTFVNDQLAKLKNDALPFKSFRKQFNRRKRISGYSQDAIRSYANYMTSFSNHIARVKFDSQFKKDFEDMKSTIDVIKKNGGDTTKRSQLMDYMTDHLEYVMNPVNEFTGIRSLAFFWFLGYNVKSAFVNLTQIPLATLPYLSHKYNDGAAAAQIARAYKTATTTMRDPDKVSDNIKDLIKIGTEQSWLDESLATELALAASENNLHKSLPKNWGQAAWSKISHYGAMPFHVAEKYNRHVTAIATYRLAKAEGETHQQAIQTAKQAVQITQAEYARWARARFMRGPVGGTAFVFWGYLQNMLYSMGTRDRGAMRMWLMFLLVAGLQGLPFAENFMDIWDSLAEKWGKANGVKDPQKTIRRDLRETIEELGADPDLIMHGLSSSSFGLANIGEWTGWPIPSVDMSGSLSLGRAIPGTELLQPGQNRDFEGTVTQGIGRFGGAAVSGAMDFMRALSDNNPDQWKRWEKAMPAFARQLSKAARIHAREAEKTRAGDLIADYSTHDSREHAELVLQGLGFPSSRVNRGWEEYIIEQNAVNYYETWKSSLMRRWNYAKEQGDEEAVKEYNAQIRDYNNMVPYPEMKIGPEARRRSYEQYIKSRIFHERGIDESRTYQRLRDEVRDVFDTEDRGNEGT